MSFLYIIKRDLSKNKGLRRRVSLLTYRTGFYGNFMCTNVLSKFIFKIIYFMFKCISFVLGCTDIPSKNVYIGSGLRLPHKFDGIKINESCKIGDNCTLFHNVTIGTTESNNPNILIGNNVYIGAYAVILGNVTIGDNCKIGAGTIIINKSIPSNSTVVNEVKYNIIPNTVNL